MLAERHGWGVYHVDDHDKAHWQRSSPEAQPTFHRLMQLRGDALWLRSVTEQVADEIKFSAEPFPLILDDLDSTEGTVVAEGAALLPHLVAPLLESKHQAIWLVPTEAFQRHYYAKRPWVAGVLAECSEPELAWENWMRRDAQFGQWILAECDRLALRHIVVDGRQSLEQLLAEVEAHFAKALAQ